MWQLSLGNKGFVEKRQSSASANAQTQMVQVGRWVSWSFPHLPAGWTQCVRQGKAEQREICSAAKDPLQDAAFYNWLDSLALSRGAQNIEPLTPAPKSALDPICKANEKRKSLQHSNSFSTTCEEPCPCLLAQTKIACPPHIQERHLRGSSTPSSPWCWRAQRRQSWSGGCSSRSRPLCAH